MVFDWIHGLVNPMPDQHRCLQELLERDPDQYLVCNALFLGAVPGKLGVPGLAPRRWTAVSMAGLAISSEDSTFFGPAPVGPGEDQRAANRAANAAFMAAVSPVRDRVNELLAEMGATGDFPHFTDGIITLPDATAVMSVPGFEFHRSDLPSNTRLVGVLPPVAVDGWQPPAWWQELDGTRPVVAVTQGTLANNDLSNLVEPTLRGLADLDVTVVAALGGQDPEALSIPTPANARVGKFVPFDKLLPKSAVLVTNGGAGGIHQALAAGTPVIVAGETEDKPANAARVAHHGLGLDLGTATPTPEAVADAVRRVLDDTEIRENVRRMAKVYAEHDAVTEIERLSLG
ncbi:glycosyltransferase [Plantactinospora sp. WMMB334]|uniref:glycosyltransferase n=1 Tax=Plantactinospora sp. WMMB334 TaxID=3404119 RepID=UPI003B9560FD